MAHISSLPLSGPPAVGEKVYTVLVAWSDRSDHSIILIVLPIPVTQSEPRPYLDIVETPCPSMMAYRWAGWAPLSRNYLGVGSAEA